VTALVLLACVFALYRVTTLFTRDEITCGLRLRIARRFPARPVPVLDENGEQAYVHNEATKEIEPAVTMKARWPVALVNCPRCLSVWFAAPVVLACHGVGLLDRWSLVVLGWLAVAGAVALIVDVVG
jgi:hypothetical protein